jgi:hypothetical protein
MKHPQDCSVDLPDGTSIHLHGVDATIRETTAGNVEFFVRTGGSFPLAWVSWISQDDLKSSIETLVKTGWYMFNKDLRTVLVRTEIGEQEKYRHPTGV